MVRVRRYQEGDGPAIRDLHERALADTGTDPADVPDIDDLEDVPGTYLDTGGEFLVAEVDGEIVGMGGLRVDVDDHGVAEAGERPGELFRMRVDPDRQRKGVGSAVLDGLEAAARRRGVDRLLAETAERQAAATRFYPANGFAEVRRRSYGEYDLVLFSKALGE
jgi:ribosomal protein S18 acetylase RimI-like enzyme